MPKKLKLNLKDLKVQSFITALTDDEKNQFIGGANNNSPNTAVNTYCDCLTVCANTCAVSCVGTCAGYSACVASGPPGGFCC